MRDHRKLRAWVAAQDFIVEVYSTTAGFPREERFGLTQQLRRASVPIASNIAEGCGRDSTADLARFLTIARGSASECESQIITALRLGFLEDSKARHLLDRVDHLRRQIHNYRSALMREDSKA